MIHSETVVEVYSKRHVLLWLISSFKAGFINSAGFLITGKYVSHVTGFGTQVGVSLGHEDYFFGIELLIIPLSFIFGGVITSWLLDKNGHDKMYNPPYWKVQGLITLLLIGFILIADSKFLNGTELPFDSDNIYSGIELLLISTLCLVCGLKNSLVTWSTFGKIRVTHLTGLSTDIGLNLLQTFSPSWRSTRFKEERFVNILRIMIFIFFSTGALISALLYPSIGPKCLYIPVLISIGMSVVSVLDRRSRCLNEHLRFSKS
jgi:uncharacterized membrane protein YoaK (UPF0700 family)